MGRTHINNIVPCPYYQQHHYLLNVDTAMATATINLHYRSRFVQKQI